MRLFYANDLPLNGDEVGVGVLQATGQAFNYMNRLPENTVPLSDIRSFVEYSKDYSQHDVLTSLRLAGMHPPLYYMILHVILKYIGNDVMILRGLSILLSLASTLLIYQLGKFIFDKKIGIIAAMLYAVSGYGLVYGTLVRPYPLAMALALLSTLQIIKLNRDDKIHLKNPELYCYAVTLLLGFYTIYHFFFVAVFHFIYMFFNIKNIKKHILPALAISTLIFIGYLPWLGSMWEQIKIVSDGNYYFHGSLNPIVAIERILWINLNTTRWLHIDQLAGRVIVKLILGSTIIIPIFAGYFFTLREKTPFRFFMAFAASFLVYGCVEALMDMNTLEDLHLLFFAIPVMFIILAKGAAHLPNRFQIRFFFIVLLLTLYSGNSVVAIVSYPKRRGQQYIETYSDAINTPNYQNSKNLLLINTIHRRFLFPLAHAIQVPVDVKTIQQNDLNPSFVHRNHVDSYDVIFLANFNVPYDRKTYLSDETVEWLTLQLIQKTYQLKETIISEISNNACPPDRLMIYERPKKKGSY